MTTTRTGLCQLFSADASTMLRQLTHWACCLLLLWLGAVGQAVASQVLVINSVNKDFYRELADTLEQELAASCQQDCAIQRFEFDRITTTELPSRQAKLSDYQLIVTIGVKAQQAFMALPQAPAVTNVLHALIPNNQSHHDTRSGHHALVLDQPFSVQLAQIRRLLGNDVRLGVLYTKDSAWQAEALREQATIQSMNLQLFAIDTNDRSELGQSLPRVLSSIDAVLMIPDKSLYNRVTIDEILLTGFLNRVPFIAYSKALAKTGALASITTPRHSIVPDITRKLVQLIQSQATPGVSYPSQFELVVNQQIADSLGIKLPSDVLEQAEVIR